MASGSRLPRAERRAQLIEAAAAAFLARGFGGTSMDDVAHEAGVSRLIVYRNFESKTLLYGAVLDSVLLELAEQFTDVDMATLAERGAVQMMLPVARRHPDAFRLLWRHAWHEPEFIDRSDIFRERVTYYARVMLVGAITDPLALEWAGVTAGHHLVDGICHWLDFGDPTRDDEFTVWMMAGIEALAEAWSVTLRTC
jgi:AcrR family transcriptional regulator